MTKLIEALLPKVAYGATGGAISGFFQQKKSVPFGKMRRGKSFVIQGTERFLEENGNERGMFSAG
ncbi:MAG: hypothetical protein G01um101448_108 [Parcubacteria group bacterium Gr01-1014_48]|nr:MAG: hypothetical protein Greene041614_29 [Parcubacteria group bacterium Greene0416_14]TSC74467.1 MAG: hypothetical protein G01um101448_108 [Parcubacteria group bacterium Gr01-1014_48]TSD01777.1 MAG: hypothetical protein Greene101415_35 [Parcubacteria group bacterium Greene1014_15]TSD08491.1 MAG: hypothetical protein Greene07144_30 [Parcubacteria group bacterium Greene0714_4]